MSGCDDYIQAHLPELCREVLGWKKSGILSGERLRELASLHFAFSEHGGLQMAEEAVKVFSMTFVLSVAQNEQKTLLCLSCGQEVPLTAEIIANASTTCQACGKPLRPIPQ